MKSNKITSHFCCFKIYFCWIICILFITTKQIFLINILYLLNIFNEMFHLECNTTLLAHDKIHYLTSHFGFPYDSTYSNKLTCSWNVKSISGKRIQIVFLYFFLTNGDYLSIFNGSKSAQSQVGRYTGWINVINNSWVIFLHIYLKNILFQIPTKITSNNNTLLLLFETDDFGSGNGFKIIYFQLP